MKLILFQDRKLSNGLINALMSISKLFKILEVDLYSVNYLIMVLVKECQCKKLIGKLNLIMNSLLTSKSFKTHLKNLVLLKRLRYKII